MKALARCRLFVADNKVRKEGKKEGRKEERMKGRTI
jgi:hypothetical protein